jgi:hypothetical protein
MMTDNPKPEENLEDEFRNLGQNLVEALRTAWDSPERKRLQQEIGNGLTELNATLKKEFEDFDSSETSQRLKSDVENLRQRVRSGEAETKVRSELLNALRIANEEIRKATANWKAAASSEEGTPNPSKSGQET